MAADYYQTLEIEKSASDDEIKRAYRKLAHRYHPDKGEGDEAKFKEVNEAYQVLGDTEKRKQYDQFGQAFQGGAGGPGAGAEGFDFSGFQGFQGGSGGFQDIFETFFGGAAGAQAPARGRDLEVQLMVDFDEAIFGVTKPLSLNVMTVCDRCDGDGAEPGSGFDTCDRCGGSGQEERTQRTVLGSFRTMAVCSKCGGRGKVPKKACEKCHGEGRIRLRKDLEVEVPAGIDNGQQIRLRGQGEAGPAGSEPGDLYVQVVVKPHRSLRREGRDLHATAEVDVVTAALGGETQVETLEGKKTIKVAAGTETGKVIRLSGQGVPVLGGGGRRGDELIEVKVKTPSKLSRRAKQLLEELREEI